MSPVFDDSLMFFPVGELKALTATSTSSALTIRGTPVKGLAARFVIPASAGTTTTILPRIYGSEDGTTYRLVSQYEEGPKSVLAASAPFEMIVPFTMGRDMKYVKADLLVTGTANYGNVVGGIVEGVGFDWTRAVDFS